MIKRAYSTPREVLEATKLVKPEKSCKSCQQNTILVYDATTMTRTLIFLSILLLCVPLAIQASPVVAFVDVNVIPMDRERVMPHQTVIVLKTRKRSTAPESISFRD